MAMPTPDAQIDSTGRREKSYTGLRFLPIVEWSVAKQSMGNFFTGKSQWIPLSLQTRQLSTLLLSRV